MQPFAINIYHFSVFFFLSTFLSSILILLLSLLLFHFPFSSFLYNRSTTILNSFLFTFIHSLLTFTLYKPRGTETCYRDISLNFKESQFCMPTNRTGNLPSLSRTKIMTISYPMENLLGTMVEITRKGFHFRLIIGIRVFTKMLKDMASVLVR